jgi:hypothetical protein
VTSTATARRHAQLPGQLSVYDELDRLDQGELRRIGNDHAFGELLLRPLLLKGWRLHEFPAFAGHGVVFVLERGGVEVRRTGDRLADVAVELFTEAAAMVGIWDNEE